MRLRPGRCGISRSRLAPTSGRHPLHLRRSAGLTITRPTEAEARKLGSPAAMACLVACKLLPKGSPAKGMTRPIGTFVSEVGLGHGAIVLSSQADDYSIAIESLLSPPRPISRPRLARVPS